MREASWVAICRL